MTTTNSITIESTPDIAPRTICVSISLLERNVVCSSFRLLRMMLDKTPLSIQTENPPKKRNMNNANMTISTFPDILLHIAVQHSDKISFLPCKFVGIIIFNVLSCFLSFFRSHFIISSCFEHMYICKFWICTGYIVSLS